MYVYLRVYGGQLAIIMRMLHCSALLQDSVVVVVVVVIVVAGFVSDPQSDKNCS